MIRKHTRFVNPNIRNLQEGVAARALALDGGLGSLAFHVSIYPERSVMDILGRLQNLIQGHSEVTTEIAAGFLMASKFAFRTETSIKVMPDDRQKAVLHPVSVSLRFFKKEERQAFCVIECILDEGGKTYRIIAISGTNLGLIVQNCVK